MHGDILRTAREPDGLISAAQRQSADSLDAPESAKRAVALGNPAIKQSRIGLARGRDTCEQSATGDRIVGNDIAPECLKRPAKRLTQFRPLNLSRFGFQHTTKHEIGYVCEAFGCLSALSCHRFSRDLTKS
jgi:hypothetical protein